MTAPDAEVPHAEGSGPEEDPVVPDRSADDDDTGWGDPGDGHEPDDDERWYADRPPHWE